MSNYVLLAVPFFLLTANLMNVGGITDRVDWRLAGRGPCAVHVGLQIRYFVSDVQEWLRQNREPQPGRAPGGR